MSRGAAAQLHAVPMDFERHGRRLPLPLLGRPPACGKCPPPGPGDHGRPVRRG
ncbi:MAG: hypothetical protein WCP98_07870 [Actinomycetes bacterium]